MKTVLIMDDVPANADVILGFLTDAGYRVWLLMEAIALWNSSDGHSLTLFFSI